MGRPMTAGEVSSLIIGTLSRHRFIGSLSSPTELIQRYGDRRSAEARKAALSEAAQLLRDDRNYCDAVNYRPNIDQLATRIERLAEE